MARNYGWNYRAGKDLSDWLVKGSATGTGWDSIVHASFQLGGAFSEKTLTAEGVEATNAIPVLHLCVGATQPDAVVDNIEDGSLRSFYRDLVDTSRFQKKRRLSQMVAPNVRMSKRKPTLRASKRQNLVDLLTEVGS